MAAAALSSTVGFVPMLHLLTRKYVIDKPEMLISGYEGDSGYRLRYSASGYFSGEEWFQSSDICGGQPIYRSAQGTAVIWWRAEGTGGRWNGHTGEKQIPGQVADSGLAVRTVLLLTVCHPGEATWEPQSAFHSNQSEEAAAHDNVIHIEHGFKDDPSVVLQLLSLAANADPAAARKEFGHHSPVTSHGRCNAFSALRCFSR